MYMKRYIRTFMLLMLVQISVSYALGATSRLPPIDFVDKNFITYVTLSNDPVSVSTPVTFGQPFAKGDVPFGAALIARDNYGNLIPIQVDKKSSFPDGSLRHAVISVLMSNPMPPGFALYLAPVSQGNININALPSETTFDLVKAGFTSVVDLMINNQHYRAELNADTLTRSASTWLSGFLVSEWSFRVPLQSDAGIVHPELTARFSVRKYVNSNNVRVEVVIENSHSFAGNPSNISYDAQIFINNVLVYNKPSLIHYHHARWRKVFWSTDPIKVDIKHDIDYLIATKAVPNYARDFTVSELKLEALYKHWLESNKEPMDIGIVYPQMSGTGGREDIGPLPNWAALYLLSMDKRAKEITLGTADLSASYPIYYRDENTDLPLSIKDYPLVTSTQTIQSIPKVSKCTVDCSIPFVFDVAHMPSFAYLPYLVTGDYYFLETLQFLSNFTFLQMNPAPTYRNGAKGLLWRHQIRGQAWALRTLGEAAAFTPDNHPLKRYFEYVLKSNLDEYKSSLIDDPYNQVHMVTRNYAFAYNNGTAMSPWQDAFFTWSIGHLVELGFDNSYEVNAQPLLKWKAKFPVSMMTDSGFCWVFATSYTLTARFQNAPELGKQGCMFTTIGEFYRNSYPPEITSLACNSPAQVKKSLELNIRDAQLDTMEGYPSSQQGYPANLQPALAVSADSGIFNGIEAWQRFASRANKPDYSDYPVWNIIPRTLMP